MHNFRQQPETLFLPPPKKKQFARPTVGPRNLYAHVALENRSTTSKDVLKTSLFAK